MSDLESEVFHLHRGHTPLLVSVPHVGTLIPPEIAMRMVPRALATEDADWHLEPLYDFVRSLGASFIVPHHARYVVDLNRPPENTPMYPGVNNTELCPTRFFTGEPIYKPGEEPGDAEVAVRVQRYWRPYHDALHAELQRLKAQHGHAILFDGHSIQAELPWLFEGRLPDLNLGTADGRSCAPELREPLAAVLQRHPSFSHVVDGRFKGGYITRNYGRPAQGLHAVQMEMGWHCYLHDELPPRFDAERSTRVQTVLAELMHTLLQWKAKP